MDTGMKASLEGAFTAKQAMVDRANTVEAYDQMIGEGNAEGNAVVEAVVQSLTDQTRSIERVVATLDLSTIQFEGSDSLANPQAVFQCSRASARVVRSLPGRRQRATSVMQAAKAAALVCLLLANGPAAPAAAPVAPRKRSGLGKRGSV